jgi:hypothetical protein
MAKLLYGSGLRVTECVRLRVKHRETAAAEETLGMCRLTYNFLDIKKRMPLHGTSPRRGLERFGRPGVGRTGLKQPALSRVEGACPEQGRRGLP